MEWRKGPWFGTQIGSTTWIAVLSGIAFAHQPAVGFKVACLFGVINSLGVALWMQRGRWPMCRCAQVFIALATAVGLIVMRVIDSAGLWSNMQVGGQVPISFVYWGIPVGAVFIIGSLQLQNWIHSLPSPADKSDRLT